MSIENPFQEKEPRFPSLEEIKAQIEKCCVEGKLEFVRILEDERGVSLYEAVAVDEKGDAYLYTYQKAGERAKITEIRVSKFIGSLEDGECVGGENLATYNEATGEWRTLEGKFDVEKARADHAGKKPL